MMRIFAPKDAKGEVTMQDSPTTYEGKMHSTKGDLVIGELHLHSSYEAPLVPFRPTYFAPCASWANLHNITSPHVLHGRIFAL